MSRPASGLAVTYQNSLRLADHFHLCPDCGRRSECDDTGQLCGFCEVCDAVRKAEEYLGPLFDEREATR